MHFSRMGTSRSLPYGGFSVQGGLADREHPWPETPWTETPLDSDSPRQRPPPPVNRMTHASKNITLPQTSFAGGKDT